MQHLQKSDGDEVFEQLQKNADQYTMQAKVTDDKQVPQPADAAPPPPPPEIPIQTMDREMSKKGNKTISFDMIKLVSSTQVSGDGYVKSVKVVCKNCNKKVDTIVTRKPGKETFIASCLLLMCSFGMVCISCLPCLIDDCKDALHTCPDCKQNLGKTPFHILD